jgi:hypothetical protein
VKEKKLEKLLNELSDATAEPVRPGLAEDIKDRIPRQLHPHRAGRDTVNIIVDLRISKFAAAAVIVITMILLAGVLGGRDSTGGNIYRDGRMLLKYFLSSAGIGRSNVGVVRSRYEYLTRKGKEVVYYGQSIDPQDCNAVLMQWKLSDGKYRIVFGDLREKTINADELIKLQARMLQKRKQ